VGERQRDRCQLVGDGVVAESVDAAQVEDPGDHRAAGRVGDQAVFGAAFGAAGRDWVRDLLGEVAVVGFADVPALDGVLDESFPGQFQHVQHVPLGDGLFHRRVSTGSPSSVDLVPGQAGDQVGVDSLVDGQQRDAGLLEFPLDRGADPGDPGDPVDRLAHHRHEPPAWPAGFAEQVVDAAVAGDGDVELGVGGALAALVELHPAGLDVEEVRDDHEPCRQRRAGAVELAGQRQCGVLGLFVGHAGGPGDGNHRRPSRLLGGARRPGRRGHGRVLPGKHCRTVRVEHSWPGHLFSRPSRPSRLSLTRVGPCSL